jgi:hypothetical protein
LLPGSGAVDSDDERELKELFDISQDDLDLDVSNDDRITNPARAPALPDLARDDIIEVKRQWTDIYKQGLQPLAEAVMKEESDARLKGKKALKDSDLNWTLKVMHDILLSTDRILLESVMLGNLSLDKRNNPKLKAVLARIQQQSAHQPSIYHQMLVSKDGKSPSANELEDALKILMGYLRGCNENETQGIKEVQLPNKDVHAIDTYKRFRKTKLNMTKVANGYRKYMSHTKRVKQTAASAPKATGKGKVPAKTAQPASSSQGSGSYNSESDNSATKKKQKKGTTGPRPAVTYKEEYCAAHVLQTLTFVDALRHRIDQIPANERDDPLLFPLCEVGYSNRSIKRLKSHKAHASSNYIMNLLEAIFIVFQDKFSDKYEIEQEVIYLIWKIDQAEVSEIG